MRKFTDTCKCAYILPWVRACVCLFSEWDRGGLWECRYYPARLWGWCPTRSHQVNIIHSRKISAQCTWRWPSTLAKATQWQWALVNCEKGASPNQRKWFSKKWQGKKIHQGKLLPFNEKWREGEQVLANLQWKCWLCFLLLLSAFLENKNNKWVRKDLVIGRTL